VQGVAARVIGGDASGWVRGILVDQGERSGVKEGMAVIHRAWTSRTGHFGEFEFVPRVVDK
jgi:cell shape-determining protein MreC